MSCPSERKYGLFLQAYLSSQTCVFFLFVLWTGPFFLLRHIFSAADKTTVSPCEANGENGEENLTGPIRLRPQNGTAVWKVNIQKSFSDHVIQNTRPCTAGSHAVKPVSQSVPTHLKYQEAMKDFTTLARRTIPPSGDIGKLIVHFCLFLLFLFCAFQFQYSNGVTLPQMIAFLSCILPCQLILSILSNVTLHKCMTFSCSFSCSSVVMPHSDSLPNFHCGNRGMFLVWLLWAKRVWFQRNILPIAMCHWVQQEAGEVWK